MEEIKEKKVLNKQKNRLDDTDFVQDSLTRDRNGETSLESGRFSKDFKKWFNVFSLIEKIKTNTQKTKEPLLAVLLSTVFPGLGQFYCRRFISGSVFLLSVFIINAVSISHLLNPAVKITKNWFLPFIFSGLLWLVCLMHAFFVARKFNHLQKITKAKNPVKIIALIAGILAVPFIYYFLGVHLWKTSFMPFTVPPDAMEPTLYSGERVMLNLSAYKTSAPKRGDVVAYKFPEDSTKTYFHRIIAFPGETVELKNHRVFINGAELKEDWALKVRHYNNGKLAKRGMLPVLVPADSYYILGDNSARSQDSRHWGFLPKQNIIGQAFKIYFPFDRSGPVK